MNGKGLGSWRAGSAKKYNLEYWAQNLSPRLSKYVVGTRAV